MRRLLTCLALILVSFISLGVGQPARFHTVATETVSPAPLGNYERQEYGLRQIRAYKAWKYAPTQGKGVLVCSIDTGVSPTNPDLASAIVGGTNTADPRSNDWTDDEGHGTHTSGIIAGRGVHILGVAPQASIYAVKVLGADGSGSDLSVNAGVLACIQHGANVINMSLGGEGSPYDGLKQAIDLACAQGIAISVSAGNDGSSALGHPAGLSSPCMVDVGAVDNHRNLAEFSNYGGARYLVAPGVNVISDLPGDHVGYASGTSMSAPYVSGCLALLMGRGLSAQNAINTILITADYPHDGFGPRTHWISYGYGELNCGDANRYAVAG